MKFREGQTVIIKDYSACHGEKGKIIHIGMDGIITVELSDGICWPTIETDLLKPRGHQKEIEIIDDEETE